MELSTRLDDNLDAFRARFTDQSDLIVREFVLRDGTRAAVVFLEGASDSEAQRDILEVLAHTEIDGDPMSAIEEAIPVPGTQELNDRAQAEQAVLRGDTAVFADGSSRALAAATAMWLSRAITEPPTSSVLRGPREGFTENLRTNITQIRRRLQTPKLRIRHLFVGKYTHTDVAIVHIGGVADRALVAAVRERIEQMDCDGVLDVNYLVEHLEQNNTSLFQQTGILEKPDQAAAKLLEGRVLVMVNGSPMAITLPFVLFENFQQSEDYYTRLKSSNFLRWIRIFSAIIGMFLPGAYVAVQIYHYTVIPLSYLYTIMNAVQGLPMTPLMEMLFVLIIFEVLHEASYRMPKYVGMAMSVVGALVLGDTAVKAGLISSPSIMIVALSTISLYAIPDLVNACKILRILFVLIGGFSGLWGMSLLGCVVLLYMTTLDSYGAPYLSPFAPLVKADLHDGLQRSTLQRMRMRPESFGQINSVRRRKKRSN